MNANGAPKFSLADEEKKEHPQQLHDFSRVAEGVVLPADMFGRFSSAEEPTIFCRTYNLQEKISANGCTRKSECCLT